MSDFWQRPEENKYGRFVAQSTAGNNNDDSDKAATEPANKTNVSGTSQTHTSGSQEWTAWGEYLGKPTDGNFVEWKKHMVEESKSDSETNKQGKTALDDQATAEKQKENKPCGKEMPEKHKKEVSTGGK